MYEYKLPLCASDNFFVHHLSGGSRIVCNQDIRHIDSAGYGQWILFKKYHKSHDKLKY